jgi:hypothetical protein
MIRDITKYQTQLILFWSFLPHTIHSFIHSLDLCPYVFAASGVSAILGMRVTRVYTPPLVSMIAHFKASVSMDSANAIQVSYPTKFFLFEVQKKKIANKIIFFVAFCCFCKNECCFDRAGWSGL